MFFFFNLQQLASDTAANTNNTDKGTEDGSSTLTASKVKDDNSDIHNIDEKTSSGVK